MLMKFSQCRVSGIHFMGMENTSTLVFREADTIHTNGISAMTVRNRSSAHLRTVIATRGALTRWRPGF